MENFKTTTFQDLFNELIGESFNYPSRNYFYKEYDFFPTNFFKKVSDNELTLSIPGYSKKDIEVSICERELTVKGEKENFEKVNSKYLLPKNADEDSVKAKVENGVLHIKFDSKEIKKDVKVE